MDIPIVILSIVQDRERGFRLGVDRYLTKPIDTDLLFREVGALHRAEEVAQARARRRRGRDHGEDADRRADGARLQRDRGARRRAGRAGRWRCSPTSSCSTPCSSAQPDAVQMLRFEKGLENVLFLVYQ